MAKLTEDEIKQQRKINESLNSSEALKCLSEHYDNDLESMIVELADSLESDDRAKLRNSLDPDYSLVDISDHDYDLDAIHEQVDYLENEAIQEIEAILEDIQSGEGYAKNWLNSLKLTIRTKSEKIKKTLNNIRLGEE
jgi:hypothetical protein